MSTDNDGSCGTALISPPLSLFVYLFIAWSAWSMDCSGQVGVLPVDVCHVVVFVFDKIQTSPASGFVNPLLGWSSSCFLAFHCAVWNSLDKSIVICMWHIMPVRLNNVFLPGVRQNVLNRTPEDRLARKIRLFTVHHATVNNTLLLVVLHQ